MSKRPVNPKAVCDLCLEDCQKFQSFCLSEASHVVNICSGCFNKKVACHCGEVLIDAQTKKQITDAPQQQQQPEEQPEEQEEEQEEEQQQQQEDEPEVEEKSEPSISTSSSSPSFSCAGFVDLGGICPDHCPSTGPFVKDRTDGKIYCAAHRPQPSSSTTTDKISSKEKEEEIPNSDDDFDSDPDDDDTKKDSKKSKKKKSSSSKKEKKKGKRKSKKDRQPHAKTAYQFFCEDTRPVIKSSTPDASFADVSRELGKRWQNLSASKKQEYSNTAEKEKEEFLAKQKQSSSSPTSTSDKKSKKRKESPTDSDDDDSDDDKPKKEVKKKVKKSPPPIPKLSGHNLPPRNTPAYQLFCKDKREAVEKNFVRLHGYASIKDVNKGEIENILVTKWKEADKETKERYAKLAAADPTKAEKGDDDQKHTSKNEKENESMMTPNGAKTSSSSSTIQKKSSNDTDNDDTNDDDDADDDDEWTYKKPGEYIIVIAINVDDSFTSHYCVPIDIIDPIFQTIEEARIITYEQIDIWEKFGCRCPRDIQRYPKGMIIVGTISALVDS